EINDATVTQVDYRNGKLATTFNATSPADGYVAPKVAWYQVDVSSGTPMLVQQGFVDPGPRVDTYFGTIARADNGNLGLTYMESSLNENVSMYVTGQQAGSASGTLLPGVAVAPGGGFMPASFREGDYSSVAVDPSTGAFWATNEYIGADGGSDI